ncbi:MAG TPA: two-component regulator propeller domain-containing protein [Chitinophagaceae bacterium]|nr:two-component regulator propeller domain-containing protein [Chitinophagaceae bacterium]
MIRQHQYPPYACLTTTMLLSLLCSLLLALPGASQTLPNRRYTTADGLAADRITCAVQDDKGFMWLGTYFGISRYDGYRFTTIQLPPVQQNKYVAAITAAHGNVYAGFWFDGGLMEYSQGRIKAYQLPGAGGQVVNNITALCPHNTKGILVAGGHNSIYHFADGRFTLLHRLSGNFKDLNVKALAMDDRQNIWAGTTNGLMVYTSQGNHTLLEGRNILYIRQAPTGVIVTSIKDNDFLITSFRHSGNTFAQEQIILRSTQMLPLTQNSFHSNNLWLADSSGVFHHLTPEGRLSAFSTNDVSKEDIHFLYADRENNLWIATHTGLVKMANLPALSYAFAEKAYGTGDITGSDSLLWITNSEHLYTIRNGKLEKMPEFRDKKNMLKIGRLKQQGNRLWVSLENAGVMRMEFNGNKVSSKQYFNVFNAEPIKVHCIRQDQQGNIWLGGRNGIFYIRDGKPAAHFRPALPDGSPMFIVDMAIDTKNNIIWAGDNAEGLYKIQYRFTGDGLSHTVLRHIHTRDGLTDGHIRSLLLDSKGMLWCGTRFGGLFRLHEQQGKLHIEDLTAQAQLGCARVTSIKEENAGAIWIATCGGIYRYVRSTGQWEAFTAASGLMDSEIFTTHITPGTKHCWALSTSGVTALQYDRAGTLAAPLVNITGITVLGRYDTAALFSSKAPSWSSSQSSIGFQFAGASFTDEKRIWYKYMLQGHDKNWSDATQANSVNYASLPPGEYIFKVLASAGKNRWSEAPATFAFTIVRPFYKSPLFFILLLCAGFAAIYFFRMYQLQQRLKLERIRTRISADLHDDIGSTLSSISIISEGVLQEKDPVASKEMIREISDNAMQLMDKMDDIIWCVNPRNDSFQHLMLRIRKFASSVFEAKGIEYDIVVDPRISDNVLPMDYRQHLYLILKEAINNLVKYSGATYATISIALQGGWLNIIVTDNGKGFDVRSAQNGNGLRNMQKRAGLMKADLEMESDRSGTRIHIRSKIK